MGVKIDRNTLEFEEWCPLPIHGGIYPRWLTRFNEFSKANWKLFRDAFTIYVSLMLFLTAQAWALTPGELDALVPTIIAAESSGRAHAVGDCGRARGLMQIQKATWKS